MIFWRGGVGNMCRRSPSGNQTRSPSGNRKCRSHSDRDPKWRRMWSRRNRAPRLVHLWSLPAGFFPRATNIEYPSNDFSISLNLNSPPPRSILYTSKSTVGRRYHPLSYHPSCRAATSRGWGAAPRETARCSARCRRGTSALSAWAGLGCPNSRGGPPSRASEIRGQRPKPPGSGWTWGREGGCVGLNRWSSRSRSCRRRSSRGCDTASRRRGCGRSRRLRRRDAPFLVCRRRGRGCALGMWNIWARVL